VLADQSNDELLPLRAHRGDTCYPTSCCCLILPAVDRARSALWSQKPSATGRTSRSGVRAGKSGVSRPLWRTPAFVSFLNPKPALSLVGGNRSSCPLADLTGGLGNRPSGWIPVLQRDHLQRRTRLPVAWLVIVIGEEAAGCLSGRLNENSLQS
jgi:hypothetical protein